MAMSAAEVGSGKDTKVWDVIASADADTDLEIPHGMSSTPRLITITPLRAKGVTGQWYVSATDVVNITITKGNTGAGSGDAGTQVRVIAKRRTHIEA